MYAHWREHVLSSADLHDVKLALACRVEVKQRPFVDMGELQRLTTLNLQKEKEITTDN